MPASGRVETPRVRWWQWSAQNGQPLGRAERSLSRLEPPLTITAITIDDKPRRPVAETRTLSILSVLLLVTDTDTDMAVQPQGCVPTLYCRRRPADTPLYRVVQNHLETFLSRGRDEWWEALYAPTDPAGIRAPWADRRADP